MIDSNVLAQIGGTLRQMQELNNERAANMAAGSTGLFRLIGRNKVDAKRKEIDDYAQHEDAITLYNNKDRLRGYGKKLLSDKRKAELAAALANGTFTPEQVSEEVVDEDAPSLEQLKAINPELARAGFDQWQYVLDHWGDKGGTNYSWDTATGRISRKGAPSVAELKAINPELANSGFNQWEWVRSHWGDGEGKDYAWDTATGKIAKKPKSGKGAMGDELPAFTKGLREGKDREQWAVKWRDATDEEAAKQWWEKNYGNETAEERAAKEDELFEQDFDKKMLAMFKGDRDKMEAFLAAERDPKMTVVDPNTGRIRLKRPDEVYYDVGNFAQYWAPEMAHPYFDKSKDLLDLIRHQMDNVIGTFKGLSDKYERKGQNSDIRLKELSEQMAKAEIVLNNPNATDEERMIAREQKDDIQSQIDSLRGNAGGNYDRSAEADAALAAIAGVNPATFASSPYYGSGLLSNIYGDDYAYVDPLMAQVQQTLNHFRTPVERRLATSQDLFNQVNAGAEAYRKGQTYTGEDAGDEFRRSGLPNSMSVAQNTNVMNTLTNAGNLDLAQRKWFNETHDQGPVGGVRAANLNRLWTAETFNDFEPLLQNYIRALGLGNMTEEEGFRHFGLNVKGDANRPFDLTAWWKAASPEQITRFLMTNIWSKGIGDIGVRFPTRMRGESDESYKARLVKAGREAKAHFLENVKKAKKGM